MKIIKNLIGDFLGYARCLICNQTHYNKKVGYLYRKDDRNYGKIVCIECAKALIKLKEEYNLDLNTIRLK